MLGLAYLMPQYWLEISLHLEGPATGQFDRGFRGFPWFQSKCWVDPVPDPLGSEGNRPRTSGSVARNSDH
jgi:hypothetical protein